MMNSGHDPRGLLPAEVDPYVSWRNPLRPPKLAPDKTCLLVIDMNHEDASGDHVRDLIAREPQLEKDLSYFLDKVNAAVGNIKRLQEWARAQGIEVMFVRVASLTSDGRDRHNLHKDLGYHSRRDDPEAAIYNEIAPVKDEIVLDKTCSSVFSGTMIDQLLRNLGIEDIIFTGILTNGCVESAVREAADIGYRCVVADDACAAYLADMEAASIRVMRNVYATVMSTDALTADGAQASGSSDTSRA
jgi:nicotinamidase-related amidase